MSNSSESNQKIIGVIPARYGSGRMPGKPLADICGKPMIWWVYQSAKKSTLLNKIIIATDDRRIEEVCNKLNLSVIMTSVNHDTPTSRLYEVSTLIDADLYLLIMGDEPLFNEKCLSLVLPQSKTPDYYVAALTNELTEATEVIDFSNQKIVCNSEGNALMISRSPIPYPKGFLDYHYEKVTGVQIFSKKALKFYNDTERSVLEKAEENDLLRFIENSIPVRMISSPYKTVSVDTYKDLEKVRTIISDKEELLWKTVI